MALHSPDEAPTRTIDEISMADPDHGSIVVRNIHWDRKPFDRSTDHDILEIKFFVQYGSAPSGQAEKSSRLIIKRDLAVEDEAASVERFIKALFTGVAK